MNENFKDLCSLVESLTQCSVSPIEAYLKINKLDKNRKGKIDFRLWSFAKHSELKKYPPNQGLVILATYAAAVGDDYGVDPSTALLIMLTSRPK